MKISIDYNYSNNFIHLSAQHTGKEGLEKVEDYFFKILCAVFLEKPVMLITIQPQEYSFAQGLERSYDFKIGKDKVLINEISKCTSSLLQSISMEEEFRRSLLLLVKSDMVLSKEDIGMVLEMVNNVRQSLPANVQLIYCNDDGDGLCLYNTGFNIENLQSLLT